MPDRLDVIERLVADGLDVHVVAARHQGDQSREIAVIDVACQRRVQRLCSVVREPWRHSISSSSSGSTYPAGRIHRSSPCVSRLAPRHQLGHARRTEDRPRGPVRPRCSGSRFRKGHAGRGPRRASRCARHLDGRPPAPARGPTTPDPRVASAPCSTAGAGARRSRLVRRARRGGSTNDQGYVLDGFPRTVGQAESTPRRSMSWSTWRCRTTLHASVCAGESRMAEPTTPVSMRSSAGSAGTTPTPSR